uniref:T9SS type A sorting domain-containing protein n=1 Tax=candidate division WOR-3 bacterium TaxID=2052148 RepID=A0A7V0Z449_UNCW3
MVKSTNLTLFIIVLFSLSWASWEHTYGGATTDLGYAVKQTSDGGYIVAGASNSWSGSLADAYLVKTDGSGNLQWQQTYGGLNGEYFYSVEQTSDSGYIMAGITNAPFANDVYLLRANSNGNLVWTQTFGGSRDDRGYSALKTFDGGYIVIGYTTSFGAGGDDAYLVKTDSGGNMVWQQAIGSNLSDRAYAIRQTQDHGYIFCGASNAQSGFLTRDAWLVRTDSLGNKLWEKFYGGSGDESANALYLTSDGGYILVGATTSIGAGSYDLYIIKTDASGTLQWEKTYGGSNEEMGWSVSPTSDGGYFIVGHTASQGAGGFDVYVLKTDASGNLQWQETYGGADWDYGRLGHQTSDMGYIIAGYTMSYGAGDYDVYLIKRDPGSIKEQATASPYSVKNLSVQPNPFVTYTKVLTYETSNFSVYDATGRCIGVYSGNRIGENLVPGIYFIKLQNYNSTAVRVVKIRN